MAIDAQNLMHSRRVGGDGIVSRAVGFIVVSISAVASVVAVMIVVLVVIGLPVSARQFDFEHDARSQAHALDEFCGDDRIDRRRDESLIEDSESAVGTIVEFENAGDCCLHEWV